MQEWICTHYSLRGRWIRILYWVLLFSAIFYFLTGSITAGFSSTDILLHAVSVRVSVSTQNSLGCRYSLCTSTKSVFSFIADPCVIRCHLMSSETRELYAVCTLSPVSGGKRLGIISLEITKVPLKLFFSTLVMAGPGHTSSRDAHCSVIS